MFRLIPVILPELDRSRRSIGPWPSPSSIARNAARVARRSTSGSMKPTSTASLATGTLMQREEATGCCRALAGPLGDCTCTIYDDRPELCRAFDAGSDDCLEAR